MMSFILLREFGTGLEPACR